MSFSTVLVANRGEIARRVFKTCKRLGYRTIAVYSDADRDAPFVREADAAVYLGESTASESYLNGEKIIAAAKLMGADAIHPGYGFLSENPEFVKMVLDANLIFIGPNPQSMRIMGDKAKARQFMAKAGVEVTPGYDGDDQSNDRLVSEALSIGLPVMIKAAAGGGGKGMSIVHEESKLVGAIEQARRLALNAFGQQSLIVERYIENPRHLEVQILGDQHGNVVHVFERECSVQRRFQKVIEEAPAPNLSKATQEKLHAAAVKAAREVDYVGAGTVEFIADQDENFYFLEMNTRLQVEHPVSEAITGLDLVALQLEIAAGETLPPQGSIIARGHAIEARLYAEDPQNDYLPSVGVIDAYLEPEIPDTRFDSGVVNGSEVSVFYDPMIAKVIAWGSSREQARKRIHRALSQYVVVGPTTNRSFLMDVLNDEQFKSGVLDTGLLSRGFENWERKIDPIWSQRALAALIAFESATRLNNSPWSGIVPSWRSVPQIPVVDAWCSESGDEHLAHYRWSENQIIRVTIEQQVHIMRVLELGEDEVRVEVMPSPDVAFQLLYRFISTQDGTCVLSDEQQYFWSKQPRFPDAEDEISAGGSVAPMPGKIVRLMVDVGQRVRSGDALVVMEAMKMEQTLEASGEGTVTSVYVAEGDLVAAHEVLVEIEYDEA